MAAVKVPSQIDGGGGGDGGGSGDGVRREAPRRSRCSGRASKGCLQIRGRRLGKSHQTPHDNRRRCTYPRTNGPAGGDGGGMPRLAAQLAGRVGTGQLNALVLAEPPACVVVRWQLAGRSG